MKKNTIIKDIRNILFLFILLTIFLLSITKAKYYFGSKIDWSNQHWILPQYFRMLFYHTHDFFPDFAFNIGGGQNIYYFAYYGLFSPIILLSYAFPFVNMMKYMITVSIILLYVDCTLFYVWIRRHVDSFTAFFGTFMFLFAMPLIYHSHRHIMFVNYMPFLLLALIAVYLYYQKKSKLPLIISSFLIVMTSFYFAIGGFLAIIIYSMYLVLKNNPDIKIKSLLMECFRICKLLFISGMMSGVLILPTLYTLLCGRNKSNSTSNFLSFIPKFDFTDVLYNPYSVGLTALVFIAVFSFIFSKRRHLRFLAIILAVLSFMPLSLYVMNGTMYFDSKVLIPILPLFILISIEFYTLAITGKLKLFKSFLILIPITLISCICTYKLKDFSSFIHNIDKTLPCLALCVDVAITFLALFLYKIFKKKAIILVPIMIIQMSVCVVCNFTDKLVPITHYKNTFDNKAIDSIVDDTIATDNSFYRIGNYLSTHNTVNMIYNPEHYQATIYSSTHNKNFSDFYYKSILNENRYRNSALTAQPKNFLFNIFMGNKYIVDKSRKTHPGYTRTKGYGEYSVYKCDDVMPIGYVTQNMMSTAEYNDLAYPFNVEALLKFAVIDKPIFSHYYTTLSQHNFPSDALSHVDLSKAQDIKGIDVSLKSSYKYSIDLKQPVNNKIIFLRFTVDNSDMKNEHDVWIQINGTRNKLTKADWKYQNGNYTFDYVFTATKSISKLNIKLSRGFYMISNLKMYTMPLENAYSVSRFCDKYIIDRNKTSGDSINGTIDCKKNGYFILSIPYDKGFTIKIDGKEQPYECVNMNFIGCKMKSGHHNVNITYQAPLKNAGIAMSLIGILLCIMTAVPKYLHHKD